MHPIQELKSICENQKTVSTSRVLPILKDIEKRYIQQGNRINSQKNSLSKVHAQFQKAKTKVDRCARAMQDYENLKVHHRNLEREYNKLLQRR